MNVKVQLNLYRNANFRVDNENLCVCPKGNTKCFNASPTKSGYNCLISFWIIITSAE